MVPGLAGRDDPAFQQSSAALGEDYVVKFAWPQAAARFVLHQITVLGALALEPAVGAVPAWYPLVTTTALRERFGRLIRLLEAARPHRVNSLHADAH